MIEVKYLTNDNVIVIIYNGKVIKTERGTTARVKL